MRSTTRWGLASTAIGLAMSRRGPTAGWTSMTPGNPGISSNVVDPNPNWIRIQQLCVRLKTKIYIQRLIRKISFSAIIFLFCSLFERFLKKSHCCPF